MSNPATLPSFGGNYDLPPLVLRNPLALKRLPFSVPMAGLLCLHNGDAPWGATAGPPGDCRVHHTHPCGRPSDHSPSSQARLPRPCTSLDRGRCGGWTPTPQQHPASPPSPPRPTVGISRGWSRMPSSLSSWSVPAAHPYSPVPTPTSRCPPPLPAARPYSPLPLHSPARR